MPKPTLLGGPIETPETILFTDEFRAALQVMEDAHEHAFITGRAGTGKSTLLRYFMTHTKRRAVVLAPTGLAAMNVGGQTIHSFFKFPPRPIRPEDIRVLPMQRRLFDELDTIIIDEISMVRADVLDAIDQSLRVNRRRRDVPFGGVQIVAFGDLLQLAPVVNHEWHGAFSDSFETPYFFSARILSSCDWRLLVLTKNYRQSKDPTFFDLLTRLGHNTMTEEDMESLNDRLLATHEDHQDVVTLTTTNAAAATINARRLDDLSGEAFSYGAVVTGDIDPASCAADSVLTLKIGAQVMLLRNDPDGRWVNGDVALVEECTPDEIRIRLRDTVYEVKPVAWEAVRYAYSAEDDKMVAENRGTFKQYPLKLAWAITIHKSQGQTLQRVIVDLGRGAFAHGQVYVALSRCESLEGLWLRRPIRPSDVRFDERVLTFMSRAGKY